jgi:NAD(P)-dependent dehydrogenase (short-subunit alcohol dehydrogenase family)
VFTVLAAMSGMEREYIRDRTLEGHESARKRGKTIGVNGVSPGLVDTPWWSGLPDDARQAYFAQTAQALPARHIATADDIADVVVVAATNANITGTIIETDGGAHLVSLG